MNTPPNISPERLRKVADRLARAVHAVINMQKTHRVGEVASLLRPDMGQNIGASAHELQDALREYQQLTGMIL